MGCSVSAPPRGRIACIGLELSFISGEREEESTAASGRAGFFLLEIYRVGVYLRRIVWGEWHGGREGVCLRAVGKLLFFLLCMFFFSGCARTFVCHTVSWREI